MSFIYCSFELDLKSRDDIPRLLRGLQHIYMQPELRERVFTILEDMRLVQADGQTLIQVLFGLWKAALTRWQSLNGTRPIVSQPLVLSYLAGRECDRF